jgi:tRNA pseudouridine55 synthase
MLFDGEIWREKRSRRRLAFRVVVGSGFYVRSWVRDIGEKLAVPATLCRLVRTRVGPFCLDDALPAEAVSCETIERRVMHGKEVLDWIPSVTFGHEELRALRDGKTNMLQSYSSLASPTALLRVLDPHGDIAAVLQCEANELKPLVILRSPRENA